MKTFYRILRFILIFVLVLPLAVPLILYVVLSLPSVQNSIADTAEKELTELLETEVSVGSVSIAPFNRVVLSDVSVNDPAGEKALRVDHLGAGFSFFEGLWNKRLVITYVEIIDLDLRLYRQSSSDPLNIQPIIDRFKKKDDKGPSKFDLAVNLVVIRRSGLSYDVRDMAPADSGRFDANHIRIGELRADLCAPVISDSRIEVEIKRMAASEGCGLLLKELTAVVNADKETMSVENFAVEVNDSRLALNDFTLRSPLGGPIVPEEILCSPVETLSESYLTISDLSPFVRGLEDADLRVDIDLEADGALDSLNLNRFELSIAERNARISAHGFIENLTRGPKALFVSLQRLNVQASVPQALSYISNETNLGHDLYKRLLPLAPLGEIDLLGDLTLQPGGIDFNGALDTDCGSVDIDCGLKKDGPEGPLRIDGFVSSMGLNPSALHKSLTPLTYISFESEADLTIISNKNIRGTLGLSVPEFIWNGYEFSDLSANADFRGNSVDATLRSTSPMLDFSASGGAELSGERPLTELYAQVRRVSLDPFVKGEKLRGDISFEFDGSVRGRNPDNINGWVKLSELTFDGRNDRSLSISRIELDAMTGDSARSLLLRSPQLDIDLTGSFSLKTLAKDVRAVVAKVYPALLPADTEQEIADFNFDLDLKVKEDSTVSRFLGLPTDIIYPVNVKSFGRGGDVAMIGVDVDAPYLRNKDKLVEGTRLSVLLDAANVRSDVSAHTSFPTKNGMLDLLLNSEGALDSLGTSIVWKIDRQEDFHGNFDFSALFSRSDGDNDVLLTDISVAQTQMVFNDSVWTVNPASVQVSPKRIAVSNLSGQRAGQSLKINGVASADSTDRLIVELDAIDVDYIFDSLNMSDAVQFGGRATGSFYGLKLLSGDPVLYTPRLKVDGLKYNGCVMGDGDIRSYWDHEAKSVRIMADIVGKNGSRSEVDGIIKPMSSELDFMFKADKAPVGFMAPFMSAFTSKISGEVSGEAHLYGTFKNLDLTGDIFAKDLSLKLDFTNTTYTTTDSVHLRPGMITFDNIRLTDRNGKTANLNGYVAHTYFHDPTFRFDITGARDFLVYDVGENQTEDPWYGLVYGNGKASVSGVPGRVDINVAMSTAQKSTFTFVMSDAEQAIDYQFITLRDKNKAYKDSIAALDPTPLIVRQLRERIRNQEEQSASTYAMTFDIGITPSASINLLMDPVGGDKITAFGSGQLRMSYSSDGDLRMYGDYKINHGVYNFTLQDIIIKAFKIKDGSKITFLGDPYSAQLDIVASYSLNANLSDLDESFLEDRELTRTSVPVDALMMVRGDIRQPEISFDLDFPTLTRDTYRKVRSIVSTEDMMNRQIIYLLALSKFYTPDYMTATHGNELVSVASSTISSRLSSMLGELSDNWSIAPAIRSDRGDFSDVQVDVALSSHLLNNRLLLNGNFGYRDNSMNNNSFIGDFDIRYLLNRAGTIQLKAYNRYNDQNYYLKSALTTQGVGLVFKRDFDNIFSFLKRRKTPKKEAGQSEKSKPENAVKNEEEKMSEKSEKQM